MVKVSKKQASQSFSKTIQVADDILVQVVKQGDRYVAMYNNKKIAEVGGHFESWCFEVENYIVCLDRNDVGVG